MFGGGPVKALLDWSRIGESALQVEESYDDSRERLGEMCTVWYADAAGAPAEWWTVGARPLSVREAADRGIGWPEQRARRLAAFEACFAAAEEPIQLILPAYDVRKAGTLVLDGTHRAVAAYRSAAPVRLFVFTLRGPVDPGILPDLMHYL